MLRIFAAFALAAAFAIQVKATVILVRPHYPEAAMENCIEGWVELKFDVLESGKATNIRIMDASPEGVFEDAAVNVVSKQNYKSQNSEGTFSPEKNVSRRINFELDRESFPPCKGK